jgi:molecular chaperone GrpE
MSDEERSDADTALDDDAIELDTDDAAELEVAMRDALDAIEHGAEESLAVDPEPEPEPEPVEDFDTVAALRRELTAERERTLRALADLENYRKRVQRERHEEHRFRALEPMREVLSVVDNLERALAAPGSVEDLKQGVQMILKQMATMLDSHGVERIRALGEEFDPSLHEAVSRDEDASVRAPTVSEELQAGYTMHGRLLRPAVVKVAMPPRRENERD